MAYYHGRNAIILFNTTDVSGISNSVNLKPEVDLGDVTTAGSTGHRFYPGLDKDELTIEGLYDDTTKAIFEALTQTEAGYAAMVILGSAVNTAAVGSGVWACKEALLKGFHVKGVVTDVNRITANLSVQDFGFDVCQLLTTAVQTVTSGGNSASYLTYGSTSSTAGGAAYLHVTAITGGTLTVTIQDSADYTNWLEIGTTGAHFTGATAVGTQRIAISGTVRKYIRALWTYAGTSATMAVAFTRY